MEMWSVVCSIDYSGNTIEYQYQENVYGYDSILPNIAGQPIWWRHGYIYDQRRQESHKR